MFEAIVLQMFNIKDYIYEKLNLFKNLLEEDIARMKYPLF